MARAGLAATTPKIRPKAAPKLSKGAAQELPAMLGCGISCSTALGAARGGWEPWGRPVRKQLPTPTTARTATAVTAKELRAIEATS